MSFKNFGAGFVKATLCALLLIFANGCKKNLDVDEGSRLTSILDPDAENPLISSPTETPFYSQSSSLVIAGNCIDDAEVLLTGADEQKVICKNSVYSFNVEKAADGSYNFAVAQKIRDAESKASNLLWIKKSSVSKPALTNPISDPYYSAQNVLTITGGCETGSTLFLSQGGSGTANCLNSNFSLVVTQVGEGTFPIEVTQRDQAGNENSTSFSWIKQGFEVTPQDPVVAVTESQVFTVSGGANTYTLSLVTNESGGSFDDVTNTYTAGTVSNVVDQIRVVDSQGLESVIDIQVNPGEPDHLNLLSVPVNSGDNQIQTIGQNLIDPLTISVVDRFENPVSGVSILFEKTAGDLKFLANKIQVSDDTGLVNMNVMQGYTDVRSYVIAKPLDVTLADVNGTGRVSYTYQALSSNSNSGKLDLFFATGSGPEDSIAADLDGDGVQDLIVLNKGENSVTTMMGIGNGLFNSLPRILNVCVSPTSILVDNFDADPSLDLLLSCSSNQEITFLSGNGNGSFGNPTRFPVTVDEAFPVFVTSADFNADGHQDFVVTAAGSDKLGVRFGASDGTFSVPTLLDVGSSPSRISIGDFDKANGPDIAVINSSDNTFSVLLNNGSGVFSPQEVYNTEAGPSDILTVDINGDTYLDIVVANSLGHTLGVYLNDLSGDFPINGVTTSTDLGPIAIDSGDFNGDNIADVAVVNINAGNAQLMYGLGTGGFSPQTPFSTGIVPIDVTIADFNNDGENDIVIVANGDSEIQVIPVSNGKIGFVTDVDRGPVKSVSGDVNGDGFADKLILSSIDNSINVLTGYGNGLFVDSGQSILAAADPKDLKLVDLNQDGELDIIMTFGTVGLRVYEGQGGGTFSSPQNYLTANQPTEVATGDFNADGFLDVAVACSGVSQISVFLGTSSGALGPRQDYSSGAQPVSLAAADINGDGHVDLAVGQVSELDGSLGVMLSNGDGSFGAPTHYNADPGVVKVLAGHFNTDAFVDVVVLSGNTSTVSVFRGQNGGTFSTANTYSSGFTPTSLAKGDFNGDNNVDLVVGNGTSGKVTVLLGSLSGSYNNAVEIETTASVKDVEVHDLNGDGSLDISVLDDLNSSLTILLGH